MALRITLPLGKEDNIKNLVFSILTKEYPLKIIDLTNFIRKRYGRSITFQAVRKANLQLVEEGVLLNENNQFSINKEWVINAKKQLDSLYEELTREKVNPKSIDSIKGEISVFIFDSLNKMMKFWEDIIDYWFENFKEGGLTINCYQGAHGWEGLLHPDRERSIMKRLKEKGIKSYVLSIGNTPLDRYIWKFYKNIGLKIAFSPSLSTFDKTYYVATYGETIVQVHYPKEIAEDIEKFFKKNKTIEELDLGELSEITNRKQEIKLTVIKNSEMAKQINKSIIAQIE
ncbi:hypothetical protein HY486_03550 [Candidatus Woesearchaeota archaeon]|nr:hypothetical protein [Candidatus Woesearchaeota archaeon]